jgi:hypothetical protein
MKVADLIEFLQGFPPEMPVAYQKFSEQCLMEERHIFVQEFCLPRPDGWIQDKRPDMPFQQYLLFPGN